MIELATSKGLAYVQYSARSDFGELVRVLPGLFRQPPEDFQPLVEERERFFAFVFIPPYLPKGDVRIVARLEVPPRAQGIPLMKFSLPLPSGAISQDWWLTDGDRQWHVGDLTPEQEELSCGETILPLDLLIERIETGWSPRDSVRKDQKLTKEDLELEAIVSAFRSGGPVRSPTEMHVPHSAIRHFLFCDGESEANALARELRTAGFETEIDQSDDDDEERFWTLVARPSADKSDSPDEQAEELEALAGKHRAIYDGWEVQVE